MKTRKPKAFTTEIKHTAESALQRAIIEGETSLVNGEEITWIDIELPVYGDKSRGKCIDLIGKDSKGNYVLCELKFRKKRDSGGPNETTEQLKEYYSYIQKNADDLNSMNFMHENAKEKKIDWKKVAAKTTRLFVVANSFYWDTWLILSKKKEKLDDKDVEYYSVNIDRYVFEQQKGNNTTYIPKMPKEGMIWEEKH
jgi:hypothetical protein